MNLRLNPAIVVLGVVVVQLQLIGVPVAVTIRDDNSSIRFPLFVVLLILGRINNKSSMVFNYYNERV